MAVAIPEIWSIRGPIATAKSTLATTFPGVSFWFDLELGAKRAFDRLKASGEDTSRHIPWHPLDSGNPEVMKATMKGLMARRNELVEGKLEAWEEDCTKYIEVLGNSVYDNIIVDTWRELWTTCHRAYLQSLQQDNITSNQPIIKNIIEIQYAVPNSWMDNWMSN